MAKVSVFWQDHWSVCMCIREVLDSVLAQFAYMFVPPGPKGNTNLCTQLKVIEREQPTIKICTLPSYPSSAFYLPYRVSVAKYKIAYSLLHDPSVSCNNWSV